MDLRSGFWQTAMDPRDMDKTAFVTRRGQFRFKVLSFGLANAPSLFQRIMDLVLAGLTWSTCLVYVDDVICFASSFEEQVERLRQVFARLSAAGLKLKPAMARWLVVPETGRISGAHRQPGRSGGRPLQSGSYRRLASSTKRG